MPIHFQVPCCVGNVLATFLAHCNWTHIIKSIFFCFIHCGLGSWMCLAGGVSQDLGDGIIRILDSGISGSYRRIAGSGRIVVAFRTLTFWIVTLDIRNTDSDRMHRRITDLWYDFEIIANNLFLSARSVRVLMFESFTHTLFASRCLRYFP